MTALASRVVDHNHRQGPNLAVNNDDDDTVGLNDTMLASSQSSNETENPLRYSPQFAGDMNHAKDGEKLCVVCGDRASGYHYNALSCEGCKGFFRRSVTRNAQYECKYGGNCMMDMWMRRKCQACRLLRCRNVGMKEICLLSDPQCAARSARRQSKGKSSVSDKCRTAICQFPAVGSSLQPVVAADYVKKQQQQLGLPDLSLEQFSEDHRQLITLIVACQEQFELPSTDDIARVAELNVATAFDMHEKTDQIFSYMVEMTILVTRLIVEFAKRLPGFNDISRENQVILLKGSASEVMMLRTARRFDPDSNAVIFGDGKSFNRDALAIVGLQEYVNYMFDFSAAMSDMAVDNTEYALLTAICIYSDRPGLSDSASVEAVQERYVKTLCAYTAWRRPNSKLFLARLLMKLVELRTLSVEHSTILYRLTIERGSLPPLLQEYFDLPELV